MVVNFVNKILRTPSPAFNMSNMDSLVQQRVVQNLAAAMDRERNKLELQKAAVEALTLITAQGYVGEIGPMCNSILWAARTYAGVDEQLVQWSITTIDKACAVDGQGGRNPAIVQGASKREPTRISAAAKTMLRLTSAARNTGKLWWPLDRMFQPAWQDLHALFKIQVS